jgi:DNA repair protein RadC
LLRYGAETLSDAEVLAILIGSGTRGFSALDVARELLQRFGNLTELSRRDVSELRAVRGMGTVRAVVLSAAFELVRRIQAEPFTARRVIRSPEDVARMYIPRLRSARTESFRVLLLNAANQVIREVVVSEGTLTASLAHPREVFRLAITESAAAVILLHNHPSGNTEPSPEDIALTRQLVQAGKLLDIPVLDHIIIAGEAYVSLRERGVL